MTEGVNPQRLKQTNMYFLHYKQLNTFDHPYHIQKYLDSETSTFLLVDRYIIFNKFDRHSDNAQEVTRTVVLFWHLFEFDWNNGHLSVNICSDFLVVTISGLRPHA